MAKDPRKISKCMDCGEPLNPRENGIFQECKGFAEYRGSAGGTNNLKFKTFTGNFMCAKCAKLRSDGNKGAVSLF